MASFGLPTIPELEEMLRDRLDALPPAARAELLHVLTLPDFERAGMIGDCDAHVGAIHR